MPRTIASGIALLFLVSPVFVSAQSVADLWAQITELMNRVGALRSQAAAAASSTLAIANPCPVLNRTLSYAARSSSRGADVKDLQRWLIGEGYLAAGNDTGYFGLLTEKAVKDFQCKEGIICNGTAATIGYGSVGPATRAAIARVCSTTVAKCVPLPSETRTQACPAGQTGIITETRTSMCAAGATTPVWSEWSVSSNTCVKTPPPPVISWGTLTGEVIERYYPFNMQRGALLVSQSNINENASQWANRNVSPTRIDITWGTPGNWPGPDSSTEEFEIRSNCAGGKRMLYLNAFTNENINQRYPIETRKAEIKIGSGSWIDITGGGTCGTNGQPYALADLIAEPYTMRLWGNIYGVDGKIGRTFFWQHTITHDASSMNSCWQNDAMTSRPAMVQEEAWWDSVNGWMNSGPNIGTGSMGANGEPDGNSAPYVRGQKIGKDVGLGWTTFGGINYCMKYQWNW